MPIAASQRSKFSFINGERGTDVHRRSDGLGGE